MTTSLPEKARAPGRYVQGGAEQGPPLEVCLPPHHSALNLLPEVRATALALFVELGIPWHASADGGPSNHLLSSQVQCVNALGQMVSDPGRVVRAFGGVIGTAEVLEIEPGRFLTFEYIGDHDYFSEAPTGRRTRGSMCTSVDAAFLHRTSAGVTELVLIEWKYTEAYLLRDPEPAKDETRRRRYEPAILELDCPVRADLLAFVDLLDEPLYQLMRQQLLASALERDRAHGADVVRVLHVHPAANLAYQASLHRPSQQALGHTVDAAWSSLLRRPDRFAVLDSEHFLDPAVTSQEYVARYGDLLDDHA